MTAAPKILFCCVIGLFSSQSLASDYWKLKIPVMNGATNIKIEKDGGTASHLVTFDILLESHTTPLQFYDSFFSSVGWEHFMMDTYEKYPHQFKTPPNKEWSSYSAQTIDDTYTLIYGTLWRNKENRTNAQVTLEIDGIDNGFLDMSVRVAIMPDVDGASLRELWRLVKNKPKSMLLLANSVGGDPMNLDEIDIEKVRKLQSTDPLIVNYIEAMESVLQQFSKYSNELVHQ